MIAKENRFHGHSSLRYVYQHGKQIRGAVLSLKYAPNDRREAYRAAVVVSRKVAKAAVVRNRIRRRIYEIIRQQAPGFDRPYDLVITVYNDQAATLTAEKLQALVAEQFEKARILK